MEIFYTELSSKDDISFSNAIQIYVDSIPANERQPLSLLKKRVDEGRSKLYVGSLGNKIVGIAFLWDFDNSEFVLLDYMAVADHYRNQKIGTGLFKFVTEKVRSAKKYLVFEVENYLFGNNTEQRKKRIN